MPGAKKFALRRYFSAKARKTSPCVLKTPQIRCFCPRWASFFAEVPLWGPCWASFFADEPLEAPCRANFFAATDIAPGLVGGMRPPCRKWWGVALHEAVVQRVAGVSDPRVVQFPHRVAVRSQLEVVRHPKCRPPRRKVLKMGSCGRGGLGLEHVASDMAHMRRCPGIE